MKYTEEDIPPALAKTVWGMMNVCNINIFMAFPKIQEDLWKFAHDNKKGNTNWVNQHPIITLLVDKLAQLNGKHLTNPFSDAGQQDIMDCYSLVKKVVEANK